MRMRNMMPVGKSRTRYFAREEREQASYSRKAEMERETGIEPATSSLGSWRSTTELLPLTWFNSWILARDSPSFSLGGWRSTTELSPRGAGNSRLPPWPDVDLLEPNHARLAW